MSGTNMRAKVGVMVLFAGVCVAIFLYLFQAAGGNLGLSSRYEFTAQVPDAFQLVPQSDVRRAGVKIGRVTSVESSGGVARVDIQITDADQAPVYKDARVLVRTKTVVGENYIDLDPGTPSAGKVAEGGTLAAGRSEDAVQLDKILSALDDQTRAAVRENLRTSGAGLVGQGRDLNRLFGAARPTVTSGARLMSLLDSQRLDVANLVHDTGVVLDTFSDRRADVRSLARSAKTTAEVVAARDGDLRATIDALAPTLSQARSTVTKLGSFSTRATPVLRDLRLATVDLTPVVRDLGPTARSARALVDELPPALQELDPVLTQLKSFTQAARPAINPLDRLLDQTTPALEYLATYSREFGSFFANVGSMNGVRDAVGQIGRVHLQLTPGSLSLLSPDAKALLDILLDSGLVTQFRSEGQNGYPLPGTIGKATLEQNFKRVAARTR